MCPAVVGFPPSGHAFAVPASARAIPHFARLAAAATGRLDNATVPAYEYADSVTILRA
jgi:hypothetical protein